MNQEQFNQLPAILTSWQVCTLGGWSRNELAAEVRAGKIKTFVPRFRRTNSRTGRKFKSTRPKYTKASVAVCFGYKF